MSFKRISAILRSNWLIDKQWADAHLPLVLNFLKGDTAAISAIMGNNSSMSDGEDCEAELVDGTRNVYEVYCCCDLNKVPNGSIAYLDIDGPMFKHGDLCSDGMEDYVQLINAIKIASNIAALIIDIDTPGGQANGPASLAEAITKCDAIKPVVGFINDGYCASAGYYFISGCREIYACQTTSQIGSIGTYRTVADIYAYYQSQGLPIRDIYAPQSSDKNQDNIQALAGDDTLALEELQFITAAFINTVKLNRKGKIVGTDWAGGKLYFAQEALSIGLIDGIKNFEQVVFRVSRLISSQQKNNSNNMAFEKTLAVANATEFEVVDGGFLLTEEHLTKIEASQSNTDAEALIQANATIEEKVAAISTLENEVSTLTEAATGYQNRIAELENEVVALGKKPSGNGTVLTVAKDEVVEGVKVGKSAVTNPDHPINVALRGLVKK